MSQGASSGSSRAMSYGEKLALCAKLTQLTGEGLLGMMEVIMAHDPSQLSYSAEDNSWDFDFKSLNNDTLWAVRDFVHKRFSKEQTTRRAYPLDTDNERGAGRGGGVDNGADRVGIAPLAGASGGSLVGLDDESGGVGFDVAADVEENGYGLSSEAVASANGLTGRQKRLLKRSSSNRGSGSVGVGKSEGGSASGSGRLLRRQRSNELERRLQQEQVEANKEKWKQNVASQQKVRRADIVPSHSMCITMHCGAMACYAPQ